MKALQINLDIKQNSYEELELMQGYSYPLEATILDGGQAFDLTGQVVTVEMLKADNTFIIQSEGITTKGNVATILLHKDFNRVAGIGKLQIVLRKDNLITGSWVINARIKAGAIDKAVGESGNIVTIKEELDQTILEAIEENKKTEQLIVTGGAASKGDIIKINSQLDSIVVNKVENENFYNFSKSTVKYNGNDEILIYDNFEKPNGSLQNTDIGYPYVKFGGNFLVSNGKAYINNTNNSHSIAYVKTDEFVGYSDTTIECDLKGVQKTPLCGLALRVQDNNNFLYVAVYNKNISFGYYENGVNKIAKGITSIYSLTDGKLTVVLRGKSIKIFYDGIFMLSAELDKFMSETKYGLYIGGNGEFEWDNLKVINSTSLANVKKNFKLITSNLKWVWDREYDINTPHHQQFFNDMIRFELNKTDPQVLGTYRTEIRNPQEYDLKSNIYSFDVKLSEIEGEFNTDISPEILCQFHAGQGRDGGYFSAPLSLMTRNGDLSIDINWDESWNTTNEIIASKGNNIVYNLGKYEKGKWYNFIFKIKWGYHATLEPMLEIYLDGKLVVNRSYLPNCMNNGKNPYFKFGIYKYDWAKPNANGSTSTKRVVWFKNVSVI